MSIFSKTAKNGILLQFKKIFTICGLLLLVKNEVLLKEKLTILTGGWLLGFTGGSVLHVRFAEEDLTEGGPGPLEVVLSGHSFVIRVATSVKINFFLDLYSKKGKKIILHCKIHHNYWLSLASPSDLYWHKSALLPRFFSCRVYLYLRPQV